jgi:hypothetical protein
MPYGGPPPGGHPGQGPGGFTPPPGGPGGLAPYNPPPAFGGAPGGAGAIVHATPGAHGPVGTTRNPIMVLAIGIICAFYALWQLWGMLNELKAFRQKDDLNPIFFFIPILGLIEMWKLPEKVLDAKRMAGIPNPEVPQPILYLLLGIYFLPTDLNEIWQAAGGGSQPK